MTITAQDAMAPLLERLRERKIVQWALAYLAGAWVVYEVLTQVGDVFGWPSVLLKALTVVLGIGLVVSMVLAWYHGEKGEQKVTGPELLMLATLLVVAGAGVAMVGRPAAGRAAGVGVAEEPAALSRPAAYMASVAVLPFDNLTGDPRNDHVANGLTEEVISQLAQVEAIKVISRTSVEALKGSGLTLPQIADTLRVEHVLEGSIRAGDQGLRVTAQLIDAATDMHVWTDHYERDVADPVDAQEEIARQVSVALVPRVAPPRAARTRAGQRRSYEAYLEGRALLHERTRDGVLGAIRAFEEAAALDTTYAPAYAGLAAAYGLGVTYDYTEGQVFSAAARALVMADRALALDSTLAEALAARAYVLTKIRAPTDAILPDIRRALRYQPNSADVHGWHAHLLTREGRDDEAMAAASRAVELDPIAPGRRLGYGLDALGVGRPVVALEQARQGLDLAPGLPNLRSAAAFALLLLGRAGECLAIAPESWPGARAMCLAEAGREQEAATLAAETGAAYLTGARTPSVAASLATYHAWIDQPEEALRWLNEVYALSPYGMDFRYLRSGIFDRVLQDPAFNEGLARLEAGVYDRVTLGRR